LREDLNTLRSLKGGVHSHADCQCKCEVCGGQDEDIDDQS
jgi:hypothetical protein